MSHLKFNIQVSSIISNSSKSFFDSMNNFSASFSSFVTFSGELYFFSKYIFEGYFQ